jgi:hypothetical protein
MSAARHRTVDCTPATRSGRLSKANQFFDAARTVEALADDATDIADAYVTLCVHAGIAAADTICCARLGQHAAGDDHAHAVQLLGTADRDAAKLLADLLGMKTKAGYSPITVSINDVKRAGRAAAQLLDTARRIASPDPST